MVTHDFISATVLVQGQLAKLEGADLAWLITFARAWERDFTTKPEYNPAAVRIIIRNAAFSRVGTAR